MLTRLRSKLGEIRDNVRQLRGGAPERPATPAAAAAAPVAARPVSPPPSVTPAPSPAAGSMAARAAALANGSPLTTPVSAPMAPPPAAARVEPPPTTAAPAREPVAVAAPPADVAPSSPIAAAAPAAPDDVVPAEPHATAEPPKRGKSSKGKAKTSAEPTAVAPVPDDPAPADPEAVAATPPEAAPPAAPVAVAVALAAGAAPKASLHADTGSTTLEAYIARAKANNRDLSTIKGGEGLNTAEDGDPYWGPVDNESSRAKAAGRVLTIDQWECISCGTCVEQTEKVFYLPSETDAKATPIAQDGPMDLIQDAIDACPVTCIAWTSRDEAEERGLATGDGWEAPA